MSIDIVKYMATGNEVETDTIIDESFEEILYGFKNGEIEEDEDIAIETEPLCASCFNPLDADEEQDIAYCERCQTTVFVERRRI